MCCVIAAMKSHALNTCVNTSVNKKVALDLRIHSRAIENRSVARLDFINANTASQRI